MNTLARNLSSKIDALLKRFPVVLLVGARQTGKTTLARMGREDWAYYDLENSADARLVSEDADFFFREHPRQTILDESQMQPALFSTLRGAIDQQRNEAGRYILTGSSSPALLQAASDSLAGRVAIVEVSPLMRNEFRGVPLPPLYSLFEQPLSADTQDALLALEAHDGDTLSAMLEGGYPEPVLQARTETDPAEAAFGFQSWMENYYQTYIARDVKALFPKLDAVKYQRFVTLLGALSGTIINRADIGRSIDVNEVTVRDYLDIAHNTFLWRMLPSFENSRTRSVVKMPKGQVRDSGLALHLEQIHSREQLLRHPRLGQHYEAFVIEQLIRGLQASRVTGLRTSYYRTRNGAEVDLILEGAFGMVPVEIKIGRQTAARQLRSLKDFVSTHDCPFGLVVNHCERPQRIADNIIELPVGCI